MYASLARALMASVSRVMNVCCTQPAWLDSIPSRSSVSFASLRNARALSAGGWTGAELLQASPKATKARTAWSR